MLSPTHTFIFTHRFKRMATLVWRQLYRVLDGFHGARSFASLCRERK